MILRLMLHLLGCKKETKMFASSGNRTRAARVAGEHSTTEPTMPVLSSGTIFKSDCSMSQKETTPLPGQLWPSG
jgi:hypothetical protein